MPSIPKINLIVVTDKVICCWIIQFQSIDCGSVSQAHQKSNKKFWFVPQRNVQAKCSETRRKQQKLISKPNRINLSTIWAIWGEPFQFILIQCKIGALQIFYRLHPRFSVPDFFFLLFFLLGWDAWMSNNKMNIIFIF